MPIIINDNSARVQYTATSSQTVFTVPYEFFANADLKVYQNSTLKTITTHYTVTGAGVTGGGTVTFVTGATLNDVITIVRDVAVARTSDFPTSGPFVIEDLNTDLDRLTAMIQQQETKLDRILRLDDVDTTSTFGFLPVQADRAGKTLAFDSNGNPVVVGNSFGSGFVTITSGTGAASIPASTTANRPTPAVGHFRFNTDLVQFEGYNGSNWGAVGGGATGGGNDEIFHENGQTVTTNYTISTNNNAGTFGPITVDSGVTVTVPSGSTWSIV